MRPGRIEFAGRSAAAALAIAAVYLLGLVPAASADLSFCPPGPGAGQCQGPRGVAVDTATAHVYVADSSNNRVDVFEPSGAFLFAFGWGVKSGDISTTGLDTCTTASGCQAGFPGAGAGQLNGPTGIAVDQSSHAVYVVDDSNHRIEKFDSEGHHLLTLGGTEGSGLGQFNSIKGVGVAPGGVVYAADTRNLGPCPLGGGSEFEKRLQKFEAAGAPIEQVLLTGTPCGQVTAFAVDSNGDFYLSSEGVGTATRKYNPSGGLLLELDPEVRAYALTVDGVSHDLFSQQDELKGSGALASRIPVIAEYTPGGSIVRRFGYQLSFPFSGLAFYHSAGGDLFGSEGVNGVHYLPLPPPGPIAAAPSLEVPPPSIGSTKATLKAEINPEGKTTEYRFKYVDEASFLESGFATAATTPPATVPMESGKEFNLRGVQAAIGCPDPATESGSGTCLSPATVYHFEVVATNSDNPGGEGEGTAVGPTFKTKPPLEIGATWASEVGTDTARLSGEVNPLSIPTTGFFEYVDDATYEHDIEESGPGHGFDHAVDAPDVGGGAGALAFGSGEAFVTRSATIFPLAAGTTYHYRLIADDPLIEPVTGPEHTFTTFSIGPPPPCVANEAFRTGLSALLPDCRAYELVSPLDKENGDILPLQLFATDLPSALDQSSSDGSRLVYGSYRAFGDAPSAPYTSQYLAARGVGGWSSHAITPLRGRLELPATATLDTELKALSPDLCQAWLRNVAEPTPAPGAVEDYPNLYRRQDSEPGCGGEGREALTTVEPPNHTPQGYSSLELQGVAAAGSPAIYVAGDNLTADAPPQPLECVESEGILEKEAKCQLRLYYQGAGGGPHLVCILPDGEASSAPCSAGTNAPEFRQDRGGSLTNAISADGSRVFWTATEHGPGKVYVRENPGQPQSAIEAGACSEAGKACTVAVSKGAEEESGTSKSQFWGAAADGSVAILTSGEDLYEVRLIEEEGHLVPQTHLVAHKSTGLMGASEDASRIYFASSEKLSGEEENSQGDKAQAGQPNLYLHEAGDAGGSARFVATLTKRDVDPNTQSATTVIVQPLYRTSRVAPDGRHASFMSAAPLTPYDNADAGSGKADAEVYLYDATAAAGAGRLICASCNPTGARPAGGDLDKGGGEFWAAAQLPVWENNLYASRVLSDDGTRLFFESTDTLVNRDTNGVGDVYEWEAKGTGGCTEAEPAFVPGSAGCVDLISSGQSPRASEFIDASPSGDDVFFATLASLLSQDYGLLDIYDARVDGGFPPPPPVPVQCEGEACQHPAAAPQAQTPASAIYEGPGNIVEPTAGKKSHKPPKSHKKKHAKPKRRHRHGRAAR